MEPGMRKNSGEGTNRNKTEGGKGLPEAGTHPSLTKISKETPKMLPGQKRRLYVHKRGSEARERRCTNSSLSQP